MDTYRVSILPARFGDGSLMDVALPGYTPSSTPSSSQVSGSWSRLKELHERLQLRSRESPARAEVPPTWREQPVRSVVIASYKKNTEGQIPQAQPHGLDRGAAGEKGLFS